MLNYQKVVAVLPARSSSIFARTGGTFRCAKGGRCWGPGGKKIVETIMFGIMHAWETLYVYIYICIYIYIIYIYIYTYMCIISQYYGVVISDGY